MSTIKGMLARLRAHVRGGATNRDLEEEIRFHIELETKKNIALGMCPSDAHREAMIQFGGVQRAREEHIDVRGARWLEEFVGDTRYALRAFLRNPILSLAGIITLALGVGANTAIFSAVNAVVLRPLPFPESGRLLMLWEENPEKGWHQQVVAPANFFDWREQVPAFQDAAMYTFSGRATLIGIGAPQLLRVVTVTGNFFSVLGARAELGRTLVEEETWDSGTHVAVLSHRAWRDRFGGDRAVIGRTVRIEGAPVQIVGVMPESFAYPQENLDAWVPMEWKKSDRAEIGFRRAHWPHAIARLKPGVSFEQANAQLQQVAARLKTQYPTTNKFMGAGMTPLHDFLIGDTRLPLLILLAAVALLLLIACANVGNLLLVQAASRERELSLRVALGAGRMRLVRQALTESLTLSAIGGLGGLALGWWGTRALGAMQPEGMLPVRNLSIDWSVLAFVIAITTLSGIIFGLAPALWSGRRAPADALRAGGRTGSDGMRMRRWGNGLVVGEVALALMLTVGAGLLVRSFWTLEHVDPGFDSAGVLAVSINLPQTPYDSNAKVVAFYDELVRRARQIPRVERAGLTRQAPLDGLSWSSDFSVAGRAPDEYGSEVQHREVSPDYFRTMRVPLIRGRGFTESDREGATQVIVINEALARGYFKGRDPIGQRLAFDKVPDSTSVWRTIVGVVGNEHQVSLAKDSHIEIFTPLAQAAQNYMVLMLRTRAEPAALAPAVRRIVAELDPTLAIHAVRTMDGVRATSMARERFLMTMLLLFAVVGMVLAIVGVYGVLAQLARSRTREMGIRIALGAQGGDVRWLVVRHGLRLTIAGLVIGSLAALLATRALGGLLFRTPPSDPLTFTVVALLLTATSVLASWIPALKASRADPALTLRGE